MASEWDGFLEALATEIRVKLINELSMDRHVSELDKDAEAILRIKLLPLLEAGQAMRQTYPYYGGPKATWTCKEAWDAAREAALKGNKFIKDGGLSIDLLKSGELRVTEQKRRPKGSKDRA